MRNDSSLCKKCFHNKYLKEYIKRDDRREKELASRRLYKQNNKINISSRQKERENTDINFKLKRRLRHRLYVALKNNHKTGSAIQDLGCSIEELKIYLESKFVEGMTWDNYGKGGWEIDHIIPISLFDLSNRDELLKACNFTNLQPLWARVNNIKGNKYVR